MNSPQSNFLSFINQMLGKNLRDGIIPILQHSGIVLTNNQQKAEAFSKYFEHPSPSIFPRLTPPVCKFHNKTNAKEELVELFIE